MGLGIEVEILFKKWHVIAKHLENVVAICLIKRKITTSPAPRNDGLKVILKRM